MNEASSLYRVDLEAFNWTVPAAAAASLDNDDVGDAVDQLVELAPPSLNIPYTVFEILVALVAIVGNAMVIYVFRIERKLRRRTNYYIVSLAIADLFVGLFGIPFAILAAIGLPTNLHACLFTISLLVVLCTISIFCLVAVSVDRYWAILHPMAYSRNVRTRTAIAIISMCWVAGIIIGLLPLFGWHAPQHGPTVCLFVKVMDYDYLVFLYFGTILTPAVLLIAFYAHIYRVVVRQLRQIVTMNPSGSNNGVNCTTPGAGAAAAAAAGNSSSTQSAHSTSTNIVTGLVHQLSRRSSSRKSITPTGNQSNGANTPEVSPRAQSPFNFGSAATTGSGQGNGTMLRVLGAAQKREVKATQNLSIIVLFFMICWMPLYTVNCVKAFCQDCDIDPVLMLALIALSHVNSAVNPLLYAYHLRDFRAALKNLILRLLGKEVPRTNEAHRRISAASRLQSMREKRSFQPRIYIDSPVYLRQQQAKNLPLTKADLANGTPLSMSSALRSVVRVASTPTDAREVMSQIAEVPSQAERESSKNLNENSCSQLSMRISKKSSQSSNLARTKQASLDYYMSDEEEDEDEGGIKISFRHEDINLESDEDDDDDEVFIIGNEGVGMGEPISDKINNNNNNHLTDHHSTDLPPLMFRHKASAEAVQAEEGRFYEAYRKGLRERQMRCASTHSLEEPGSGVPSYETIARRLRDLQRLKGGGGSNDSKYSSTGTISSEDMTEFRDKSSSSVFIIEHDKVQLSPSHSQSQPEDHRDDPKTTAARSPRRDRGGGSLRKNKELRKPSPLQVVTQLIFASHAQSKPTNNGSYNQQPPGLSGKFSYLDVERREGSQLTKDGGEGIFKRSVSDS